ncbi:MAG TPA: PAS domain S-box protein [Geomonas sp.]
MLKPSPTAKTACALALLAALLVACAASPALSRFRTGGIPFFLGTLALAWAVALPLFWLVLRQLQEARRELHFLQALLDAIPAPIFYKDAAGIYLGANRAFEACQGLERSQLAGKSAFEISPPELAQVYSEADRELLDRGGEQRYETQKIYADGTLHDVIVYKAVFSNGEAEPGGIVGTLLDITGRKRSEDQLRKLSCAVEQSPGVVVITDTAGTIEYVNRKFVEVTGYSSAEAVGSNPRLLKSGATPDEVYRDLWRTIAAGEEWRGEFQNKKKGGEFYFEAAIISPVKDDSGTVSHFIALKEDITERRAMESALRHAQKMESLGTLTGGVAHDFNNILTAIIGYASLIQMKSDPSDPCARFAGQVVASAEKAAVLTRGLVAYSRSRPMHPSSHDLNEIVGRVDRLLSRVLGEGIALSTELFPEPLRIFADGGQLEQLLMNLAVNARDAMAGGGSLGISTRAFAIDGEFLKRTGFAALGRYAQLSVSDSGAGLDQATRERIFEPFFTAQGVGGGPGLGLSIVHGIVEQHKGYIEVESAPGKGSVFRVYLPLFAPAPLVMTPARKGSGGETVLVVEDNPEVRAIIGEVLRGEGYLVLEAADSEEGVRHFARHSASVALLLVDVVMPGRSGLELYREIRALSPGVQVLFMSGYPEERIRAQGVLASDLAFIAKPLAPAELLNRVRGVLGG